MRIGSSNKPAIAKQYYLIFAYVFGIIFLLATNVAFISDAQAASCGAKNQYACKITFKRLKACNKGLHKNWKTKRCVSNKNLVPKPIRKIIPPKQKNCGKLRQYACRITPTRLKACNLHLVKDKRTNRCRKVKSIIKPRQTNCGKLGQYACKPTIIRPKACDFKLHRDNKTRRCVKNKTIGEVIVPPMKHCGKLDQRACKKWERLVKCDKGLRRYPPTGNCVKRKKVNIKNFIKTAKNVKNESFGLIKIMATGYSCYFTNPPAAAFIKGKKNKKGFIKALKKAIKNKDANFGLILGQSNCVKKVVSQASREGYETLTIGYSGGASFVVGGFADNGFAFDVKALNHFFKKPNNRRVPTPTFYQTKGYSQGIQAGIAGGFNLGLFKDSSKADTRGSDTHGVTFEAGTGVGGGAGVWFDYNGKLDGISASAIAGVSGKAGAYNRINTAFYNMNGANVVNCGARNQRACKAWESVPACNSGLKHNLTTGKCHVKARHVRKLNCGANGQRVCTIQEQVPGCNPGLKIDFKLKRCVYK